MLYIAFTILMLLFLLYKIVDSNSIKFEYMKLDDKGDKKEKKIKIAHLSDVHIREKDYLRIMKILDKVKIIRPDIIVVTGDLLDSLVKDYSLDYFCMEIVKIAPTIAIPGNHEESYPDYAKWKSILQRYGVVVLENEFIEMNNIVFVGLTNKKVYSESLVKDIENIDEKDIVLLVHRPELFKEYCSKNNSYNPNIVLTGHAHGGQFRLFNRGLYSPGQGLFPNYTSGVYNSEECDTKMIVSRGLGHCAIPIRFNNSFHIPVIEI